MQGSWKELLNSLFWCWFGMKGLERNFKYGPNVYRGAVPDKICRMANFDPNWKYNGLEMRWSRKELLSVLFAITFLIIGVQGWNFETMWAPMVVTSGVSFSRATTSIVEVTVHFFVCSWHLAKFAHRWPQWTCQGTIGWEIWNLMVDTCFGGKCNK